MSRIRDALNRARQEHDDSPALKPVAVSQHGKNGAARHDDGVPQNTPPSSSEAILTQCPRTTWTPDTKTMLFFGPEQQSDATEKFRTLRARISRMNEQRLLRKILITSPLPQEGRSFVAANLAQVLAFQPGCRTLLIDADLRNPSLHLSLGTAGAPGLAEYLSGQAEAWQILRSGQIESLFFVPAGCPPAGPSELLGNGRLKSLIDRMGTLFDSIILDSPAALPVSDAGLISNYCDGGLMIVRSDVTPSDDARKACEKFLHGHVFGLVLNGVSREPAANHYLKSPGRQNVQLIEVRA